MKKLFLAGAAAAAVCLPMTSAAQMTGSRPGLFDVSKIRGWVQIQSDDANVRQWAHTLTAARTGTSCNIVSSAVPFGNAEFQAIFDSLDEQVLLSEMKGTGVNYVEISPIQTADLDGTDAFRISSRVDETQFSLTAVQIQVVINSTLMAVTCGSIESTFGEMVADTGEIH